MRKVSLLLLVALSLVAAGQPVASREAAPTVRTGVFLVDHGEPPIYNEDTYESFRKFFEHLIEMGLIPSWVALIDNGTVLQDPECFGCDADAAGGPFIDAWLDEHPAPAAYSPASSSLPAHHFIPGGPGQGEPDIFEHVGLGAWHEWQIMGGRSPNFDQKLAKKIEVIRRLKERYGSTLPVRVGYGIDPRIDGGRQDVAKAVTALVNKDRVDRIIVAYHGVGFSDIMQTHMLRHEIHAVLEELGSDAELVYTDPIGTTDAYLNTVVKEVQREVNRLPEDADVAIHLSGHGLSTTTCGEYECGEDAYHEYSRELFERTEAAIDARVTHEGRLGAFHLYGDGATDEDDPDDLVDSPLEALEKRKKDGFTHVIDIPYEFDSDSRDTLIILRQGYARDIPDWDEKYDSRFRYEGLSVKISNSAFGVKAKTKAYETVILDTLRSVGFTR